MGSAVNRQNTGMGWVAKPGLVAAGQEFGKEELGQHENGEQENDHHQKGRERIDEPRPDIGGCGP